MGENTKIAWATHTFSPWQGCTKVVLPDVTLHESCRNCYAEARDSRHLLEPVSHWGKGQPRWIKKSGWNEPLTWARKAAAAGERHRVFCASLGEILDEEIDTQPAMRAAFDRTMQLIRDTALIGGLDWLLLSKRPERWRLIPEDVRPLVWLGTSAADQKSWNEMVPRLVAAEGFAKRFVSLEPQISAVDPRSFFALGGNVWPAHVDWIIQGGESGTKARPFDIAWARDVRDQCRKTGVSYFLKQLGKLAVDGPATECVDCGPHVKIDEDGCCAHCGEDAQIHRERVLHLKDRTHGANPSEWPEDLRVQEVP